MTKRFEGKEMLGCWVSTDLIRAIKEWRSRPENHGKSKTDFVIEAAMDKLDAEKIPYDRALVLQDGRSKLDLPTTQPVNYSPNVKKLAQAVLKRPTAGRKPGDAESNAKAA